MERSRKKPNFAKKRFMQKTFKGRYLNSDKKIDITQSPGSAFLIRNRKVQNSKNSKF